MYVLRREGPTDLQDRANANGQQEDRHPAVQGSRRDERRAALGDHDEPGHRGCSSRSRSRTPPRPTGCSPILMGDDVEARRHFIQQNAEGSVPGRLDAGELCRRPRCERSNRSVDRGRDAVLLLDYAMWVIVSRALPDVRDGLKPVHRRILFSMLEGVCGPPTRAEVRRRGRRRDGKYHPHGDQAVYDAHGPDGPGLLAPLPADRSAGQLRLGRRRPAGRHAVHRSAPGPLAMEMLRDIDKETVDFVPNFDGYEQEPVVLPVPLPQPAGQRVRTASPWAWPPTSPRTTWARSWTPSWRSSTTRTSRSAT